MPKELPKPEEIANLKRLASGIIRTQGNRFIKELLRDKGIRIGLNKETFENNLYKAIESGNLLLKDIETWLKSIEGWGNQHVYLFNLTSVIRKNLTNQKIRYKVQRAGLDNLWNGDTVLAFPDKPTLTSISFKKQVLRLVWQECSPGWTPVPDKDFEEEDGIDLFKYHAYRKVEKRVITRFEAHLDKGLGGLFIARPIQDKEHDAAIREAKQIIGLLLDLQELENNEFDISVVSRNIDQQNVPTNTNPNPEVKAQKSRLSSGGAYVEFAAQSRDSAYWEERAIGDIRRAVRNNQLPDFQGRDGVFIFQEGNDADDLDRPLRIQLYGKSNRVRMWAQMDVDEVWKIITKLSSYQ